MYQLMGELSPTYDTADREGGERNLPFPPFLAIYKSIEAPGNSINSIRELAQGRRL